MTVGIKPEHLRDLKRRLGDVLNAHLCEMRPEFDDSMVGFNEAWAVVRKFFDDELKRMEGQHEDSRGTPAVGEGPGA